MMIDTQASAWLTEYAIPLASTADSRTDPADLGAWTPALAGVRVLGLGEATHGTREFFTLKHRLIRHLVEHAGTRTVAMEASEAAAVAVDDYVVHGRGWAGSALRGLGFWIWDTVEVLDMITWLREHNAGLPEDRRVRFVGVDPQAPGPAVDAVRSALRDRGRTDLAEALGPMAGKDVPLSPSTLTVARTAYEVLADAPDPVARHAAQLVRSARLATAAAFGESRSAVRDRLMAEALGAAVEADPGDGPVVCWAHNGHVRVADGTMGHHLRERRGEAYYGLGLTLGEGGFRARRTWARRGAPTVHRLGSPPPAFVEGPLTGDLLIDLRAAPEPGRRWAETPSWTRSFGAVAPAFPQLAATPIVPGAEFDGLAHVASTSPSTPR